MPIRIRPVEQIVKKYVARAAAAGGDYAEGVAAPSRDQAEAAIAAAGAYAAGVQEALADDRFVKGVRAAGSGKWAAKARTVGAQRYPGGITAGQGDFRSGVGPFLETISGLELPPRFPRGSPQNMARVQVVAQALRAKALAE